MDPSLQDVYQEIRHVREDVAKNDTELRAEIAENNALLREYIVKSDYHAATIKAHGKQIECLNALMNYGKGVAGILTLGVAWVWLKVSGLKFW